MAQNTIGYDRARNLMRQLKWQGKVQLNKETLEITRMELFHPNQPTVYIVRKDAAKKLMAECMIEGPYKDADGISDFDAALVSYDFNAALICEGKV